MQGASPSLLAAVARSSWALITPISFRERVGKAVLRIAIFFSPVYSAIPGIGRLILALQGKKEISY